MTVDERPDFVPAGHLQDRLTPVFALDALQIPCQPLQGLGNAPGRQLGGEQVCNEQQGEQGGQPIPLSGLLRPEQEEDVQQDGGQSESLRQ